MFTTIIFPILIGSETLSIDFVVLGFGKSIDVVDVFSISYPWTYAFPSDIWSVNKLSDGVFPFWVIWFEKYSPLFAIRLFNVSLTSTENGSM